MEFDEDGLGAGGGAIGGLLVAKDFQEREIDEAGEYPFGDRHVPAGEDKAIDEVLIDGAGGLVVLDETRGELLEAGAVAGEDRRGEGGETVGEGDLRRDITTTPARIYPFTFC